MGWFNDLYTIQAGDAAAVFACRGWNMGSGAWETLPGLNLSPSRPTKYRVKSMDIRAYHASGAVITGVRIWVAVVIDHLHTGMVQPLVDGYQSVNHTVSWQGDAALAAGIMWRVPRGGLIAGDVVGFGVGYDG
jgi:hypothetical protein